MKFEEALKAMREGKKVVRKAWKDSSCNYYTGLRIEDVDKRFRYFRPEDILAEDWEIVETKEGYLSSTFYKVGDGAIFNPYNNQLYCILKIANGIDLTGRAIRITIETVD